MYWIMSPSDGLNRISCTPFSGSRELIDKIQKSFGVALYEFELILLISLGGLTKNFSIGVRMRVSGAEFMAYIGKELYLHHVEFMHADGFLSFLLNGELHLLALLNQFSRDIQSAQHKQNVDGECCFRFPEGWKDGDLQLGCFRIPDAVVVGSLYFKGIITWIEVGESDASGFTVGLQPVVVQSYEFVTVLIFSG